MSTKYPQLKVEKRQVLGRQVKNLRKQGILPANLYGKSIQSQALQVLQKEFLKIFMDVAETGLVTLMIKGEKNPRLVLIHNPQKEPLGNQPLHVDFRQVDLKEKITASVPLELEGEAPGVAVGGVLLQLMNEIEVEALPTDLPEQIIVNIAKLEQIGQAVSVADLVYDKAKVQLKIDDPTALVVKIEAPAKEEVEVKPAPPAGGAPAEGAEAKPEEGEKPAEDAKPAEAKPAAEATKAKTEEKK